jgi:hypothetical protein
VLLLGAITSHNTAANRTNFETYAQWQREGCRLTGSIQPRRFFCGLPFAYGLTSDYPMGGLVRCHTQHGVERSAEADGLHESAWLSSCVLLYVTYCSVSLYIGDSAWSTTSSCSCWSATMSHRFYGPHSGCGPMHREHAPCGMPPSIHSVNSAPCPCVFTCLVQCSGKATTADNSWSVGCTSSNCIVCPYTELRFLTKSVLVDNSSAITVMLQPDRNHSRLLKLRAQ